MGDGVVGGGCYGMVLWEEGVGGWCCGRRVLWGMVLWEEGVSPLSPTSAQCTCTCTCVPLPPLP